MNTHFLECYNINICQDVILTWQFEGKPSYKQQIILPQGINEIIFSFSDTVSFRYMSQKQTGYTPRCFVNGMTTTPICLNASNHQFFFGVVFYPHALKKLMNVPPGIFLNTLTDLTLVDKELNEIWHRLAEAENFDKRVEIIRCWIQKKEMEYLQTGNYFIGLLEQCYSNDISS